MISFLDNQPQLEEILADAPPLAPPTPAPAAPAVAAVPSAAPAVAPPPVAAAPAPVAAPAGGPPPPEPTQGVLALRGDEILERPDVVEARVYRLRSGFVRHNVYITLGWVEQGGQRRPMEIFFNSKDLTRSPEYAILTRLISALFRKSADPAFILEELRGIHDPAGGVYKNGRYMLSFYAEVAEVIERFFYDVGILRPQVADYADPQRAIAPAAVEIPEGPGVGSTVSLEKSVAFPEEGMEMGQPGFPAAPRRGRDPQPADLAQAHAEANAQFKICPECSQRTLKLENGCDSCLSCGYSKCDK
jgi:ribonucleoside-diphosphate reductase alpha chain